MWGEGREEGWRVEDDGVKEEGRGGRVLVLRSVIGWRAEWWVVYRIMASMSITSHDFHCYAFQAT